MQSTVFLCCKGEKPYPLSVDLSWTCSSIFQLVGVY